MNTLASVELTPEYDLFSVELALVTPLPVEQFPDYYPFDTIEFNDPADVALQERRVQWHGDVGALVVGMPGGGAVGVGLDAVVRVYNPGPGTLARGLGVVRTGVAGLALAVAGGAAGALLEPTLALGLLLAPVPAGGYGYAVLRGVLRQLDTTGAAVGQVWAAGDTLYLHPSIPGALSNVRPSPPAPVIRIGTVVDADATDGVIYVLVQTYPLQRYGAFTRTEIFTFAAPNTAYAVPWTNATVEQGVEVQSPSSVVQVDRGGSYDFTYTLQVSKTGGNTRNIWVWARINGVDVPNSAVQQSVAGSASHTALSGTIPLVLNATDTVQLMVGADSIEVVLEASTQNGFRPGTLAAALVVRQTNPA